MYKAVIKNAQGLCQIRVPGICIGHATQVDHRINLATLGISRSDPRSLDRRNLQAACEPCHDYKSYRERVAALAKSNKARAEQRRRRRERGRDSHPGDQ
ncbi:HNH endonuclease [Mycobacteroides abscessus]|nr:HNH endonuclease [Mycobacteroides abscessus]MDM2133640.1 HNH endonuclease [Mycobacteroides abscessus]MDM2142628.1 HNH endonuclease [Mycobacteroides abscessus]MDM2153766.1 HNH endonuclease [Mycobacteroides abscessus]MDM2182799.1 HNH endonuclease [Mycobacteroides abscessus]